MTINDGRAYRIALLEDNPVEARLARRWLGECAGYEVTHVDSIAAFHCATRSQGPWDLVLSDVNLPDGDALTGLAAWDRPCPVLFMTAGDPLACAIRALRTGFEDFMPKPLERDALLSRVESLIASGRSARSRRTVMAIGAHPDDVEIGVGGALAGHIERGDRVVIVTLSGGARGGDETARAEESKQAAAQLGAELLLGDFEDAAIGEGYETIRFIEGAIAAWDPSVIYTHTLRDNHQDHRAVHRATMVAARQVPNVYCYQAPSTTIEFSPTRFVTIDAQIEGKIALIAAYRSQTSVRTYLSAALIESTARYWGRFAQYKLVEPLEIVRERA